MSIKQISFEAFRALIDDGKGNRSFATPWGDLTVQTNRELGQLNYIVISKKLRRRVNVNGDQGMKAAHETFNEMLYILQTRK